MRGKSYLAMGGVSMGIGGSIAEPPFLENFLGMRAETIDMSEFAAPDRGIYDHDEYERALAWTKENCQEGEDLTRRRFSRAGRRRTPPETSVKMALIARDLMIGNPRLAEMGYGEERMAATLASGFQDSASGPITCPTATLWRRS